MGDRANIKLVHPHGESIYLYTHWRGSELPRHLASGLLRGKDRWLDPSYLTRIVIQEVFGNKDDGGISTYPTDNDCHPFLTVDTDARTVSLEFVDVHLQPTGQVIGPWKYEEYIALPSHAWRDLEK